MSRLRRIIPSTPGARRRAFILTLYLVLLAVAVSVQAVQHRADTVYLYIQGDVAYAQARGEAHVYPLFPLAPECGLRWTNGAETVRVSASELASQQETDHGLPADSLIAAHFATIGDITVLQGMPWVTIRSKLGTVRVMADCPPPPDTTHHVYIYVQGTHLFLYDTLNEHLVLLMPLRDLLVWSGEETWSFGLDALVTRPEDRQGYTWLPSDATVLGDFASADEIFITNLDETQVQLRYGGHELTLVSYDR